MTTDWSKNKPTEQELLKYIQTLQNELVKQEELKNEIARLKKELKVQTDRNNQLAERAVRAEKRLDILTKQPTKEMLLRVAPFIPKDKVKVISKDEKTGKWK